MKLEYNSSQFPKFGGAWVRVFFVVVKAQVAVDPSFMKDRVKAIFF